MIPLNFKSHGLKIFMIYFLFLKSITILIIDKIESNTTKVQRLNLLANLCEKKKCNTINLLRLYVVSIEFCI